eukprot:jgi/Mesvir1/10634/Mv09272-RA.1
MACREGATTLLRRSLDSAPRALRPTPLNRSLDGSPSSSAAQSSGDGSPMAGVGRWAHPKADPSNAGEGSNHGSLSNNSKWGPEPGAQGEGEPQERRPRANSEDLGSRRPDLTLPTLGGSKTLKLTKNTTSVRDLATSPSSSRGDTGNSSGSPTSPNNNGSGGASPPFAKPFPFSPNAREMWSSHFVGDRARTTFTQSAVLTPTTYIGRAREPDAEVADEHSMLSRSASDCTNSSAPKESISANEATAGTSPLSTQASPNSSSGGAVAAWQRLRVQTRVVAQVRACGKQLDPRWDVGQLTQELRRRLELLGPEKAQGFVPAQSERLKLVREAQDILVKRLPCFMDLLHLVREEYESAFELAAANLRESMVAKSHQAAQAELDRLRHEHKVALKELRAARNMLDDQKRVQRDAEMETAREILHLSASLAESYSNVRDLLLMLNAAQQGRVDIRTLNVKKAIELLARSQERQRQLGQKHAQSRQAAMLLDPSAPAPMEEDFDDLLTAPTDDFDDFGLDEYMTERQHARSPQSVPVLNLNGAVPLLSLGATKGEAANGAAAMQEQTQQ